jgi:DEAD/DEAH box helicase domain-containing protein
MSDAIVVDVEIKKRIDEVPGGWDATDQLGVSCAVVYEFETDRFLVFDDREDSLQLLQKRIMRASDVIGFNTWKFDFPVIWGLKGRQRVTALEKTSRDILRMTWIALGLNPDEFTDRHRGWSLENLCIGTLGRRKTGQGALAPDLYKEGKWGELISYCINDVALTRDLWKHIVTNRSVTNGVTDQTIRFPTGGS